jgi:transposase-like protein
LKKVYPKLRAAAKPPTEDFLTTLEVLCRQKIGEVLQAALEAEVDEFLGRVRGARGGGRAGYRDGHEEQRTITYGSHPIEVRRPRVRQSQERFESKVLPPYRRRFADVDKTLHELWIQGLSTRDFEPSLRALLGQETPLSPSTISRVNKQFHDEYKTWCKRSIENEFVYLWADGVYLGAGPGDERRVMLVVMGVDINGHKALLAVDDAFAESEESWTAVFESLRDRGLKDVALLVADGAAGIWSAFGKSYPRAAQQRCWLHKMRNVLDKVPERIEDEVQNSLREIMNAENRKLAETLIAKLARSLEGDYSKAAKCLRDDSPRMLAYYEFPEAHWRHLRTTNIIESNFDPVRSRTNVCKRLRSGTSATYLVFALLVRRSDRWRRFNGHQLLADVHKQLIKPTTGATTIAKKKAA